MASGEDGSIELPFAQLVAGNSYTLTETKAPLGYELVEPATFTVGADGTFELAAGTDAAWSVSEDGVTLTAADEPIEIQVAKVSAPAGTAAGDEGEAPAPEPLAGAEFTLSVIGGTTFADGTTTPKQLGPTGEDGVISIESATLIAGGMYKLAETKAPAGYELANPVRFTVLSDGTLHLDVPADPAWSVSEDNAGMAILTATDEPIEARLVKTSLDGAALPGAEFELAPARTARRSPTTPLTPSP